MGSDFKPVYAFTVIMYKICLLFGDPCCDGSGINNLVQFWLTVYCDLYVQAGTGVTGVNGCF